MKKNKIIEQLHIELNALPIPDVLKEVRKKTPIIIKTTEKEKTGTPFKVQTKRVFAGTVALLFVLLAIISAFIPVLYREQYTTLSIDINPSLELTLDQNQTVIKTEAINADAASLLSQVTLLGTNLNLAMERLLNKATENGYLLEGQENAVLFAVKNKNSNIKNKVQEALNRKTNSYFTEHNMAGGAIFEEYKNELKQEFDELKNSFEDDVNISPAKYLYIKRIIERFPNLAGYEEHLAKMGVSQLNKLLTQEKTNPNLVDLIESILENRANNGNGPRR